MGLALLLPDQVLAGETSGRVAGERILSAGGSLEVARLVPGLPENLLVTDIGTAQVALGRSDDALDAIGVVVRAPSQRLIDWLDRLMPGFSAGIGFQTLDIPGWTVRACRPPVSTCWRTAICRGSIFDPSR